VAKFPSNRENREFHTFYPVMRVNGIKFDAQIQSFRAHFPWDAKREFAHPITGISGPFG
jgi:hypothetical protein